MGSYSKFFAWGALELVRSGFGLHPRWVELFLRLARFMAVDDDGCVCVSVSVCGCGCGCGDILDREYYYNVAMTCLFPSRLQSSLHALP